MSDTWDFYFANVNDEFASLFVDLGLADVVPDGGRPWLLWAWVYMNAPNEQGMSTSEEAPQLDEIEEALMEAVEAATAGELVGRITTAGRREFYFYSPTHIGYEDAVQRAMQGFGNYRFDTGVEQDPDWNHYLRVLYPSPHDVQRIKNRHVIEVLSENGDQLEKPRIVAHWAYFSTEAARAKFVAEVRTRKYAVISEHKLDEPGHERPFCAQLERIDSVDWGSINDVTIELFDLAEANGGEYDGWETGLADQ